MSICLVFDEWRCIVLMYRALSDAPRALQQYEAAGGEVPMEGGNSKANLYHWLHTLGAVGNVDAATTADAPLHAVFTKNRRKTYAVYNASPRPLAVKFSDGRSLSAAPKKLTVAGPAR